jgi:hypothetical protein
MAEVEQRTMRMYLQSMPKSGFACVFVTFIVAFTATLLVGGLAGSTRFTFFFFVDFFFTSKS